MQKEKQFGEHLRYISGDLLKNKSIIHPNDEKNYRLTPQKMRQYFKFNNIETVVGFQTRNPIHRAHFELTKYAMSEVKNQNKTVLFISPACGITQDEDIDYKTRLACYKAVLPYYITEDFETILNSSNFKTIVAPTNAAFIAAGFADVNAINNASPIVLASILNYHIFASNIFLYQFKNGTQVKPLSGVNIAVTVNNSSGAVSLTGGTNLAAIALIKSSNFITNNGLLYTVNQLLRP